MATFSKIAHYVDQPLNWNAASRCMVIRGWCFGTNDNAIQAIRLRTRALIFVGMVGRFRPDVKASLPDAPDDYTGFEIRAALPTGHLDFSVEIQLADGSWRPLFTQAVNIRRRWRPLWLGEGDWTELMFSQVPCHMQYPPRALAFERFPESSSDPKRRPKLSIVTPSFQQARFLADTMHSVLKQTEACYEYVVQDGGSTDDSIELLRRFAGKKRTHEHDADEQKRSSDSQSVTSLFRDQEPANRQPLTEHPRLPVWASETDAGQADAIAKGFAKTSGNPDDLMAWINSDDFYLPGTFAFVADFFALHPAVDVIYGHRLLVDETSREIGRWFLPEHDHEVLKLYDFVPQETMFWRRRIWDKIGGIDPSHKFAMDWDLLMRFQAASAHIVRVPYFLACFRIHSSQKTAALMDTIGQQEIDALRFRTHHRHIPPAEIEGHPKLLSYLRRSAWIKFLWQLGIRA